MPRFDDDVDDDDDTVRLSSNPKSECCCFGPDMESLNQSRRIFFVVHGEFRERRVAEEVAVLAIVRIKII